MSAPAGGESIIGPDNRFRITATTTYPHRAVVLITFDPPGPGTSRLHRLVDKPEHDNRRPLPRCGRLRHVLSSLHLQNLSGPERHPAPFGSCTAASLHSVVGWVNSGSEQFDYGAIRLNCNVGGQTGWFGWWCQDASLNGLFTRVSGYPGDKPLTQWQSTDSVRVTQPRQIFYQNDTVGGNSGGPVWQNRSSAALFCHGVCAMGIHAYGLHGAIPHSTNNHGTRITQARHNNFCFWRGGC